MMPRRLLAMSCWRQLPDRRQLFFRFGESCGFDLAGERAADALHISSIAGYEHRQRLTLASPMKSYRDPISDHFDDRSFFDSNSLPLQPSRQYCAGESRLTR
jgi:hypothetical protein